MMATVSAGKELFFLTLSAFDVTKIKYGTKHPSSASAQESSTQAIALFVMG